MKKALLLLFVFAFIANVSAQLKVNSSGDVGIGGNPIYKMNVAGDATIAGNINLTGSTSVLNTNYNVPVTFKVGGATAGFTGSSGNSNVAFGYGSLYLNFLGSGNTAVGSSALSGNQQGYSNTANGYQALYSNYNGFENTAVGYQALYTNSDGFYNTAIGYRALYSNTHSYSNTAIGFGALLSNTTGRYNTAIGNYALSSNINGEDNTAIGSLALYSNTVGSCNTAVGEFAGVNAGNLSNAIAIGYGAQATTSDQVVIGNYTVNSVGGVVNWTTTSDGRAKKNTQTNVPGLAFINNLQPITYNLNLDALNELQKSDDPKINAFRDSILTALSPEKKEIMAKARANKEKQVYSGFVAQDVEKAAKSLGYDFSGVDAPENGKGTYGLRYAEFVVPLVKAVQELSEQNNRLQDRVDELTELLYQLKDPGTLKNETPLSPDAPAGIEIPTPGKAAALHQNIPNPFRHDTQINYYLPESVGTAYLCFYDLQGKQLKQIKIAQRGEGLEIIQGSQFAPGIYLYALIADGLEVDVKRMILTE